MNKSYAVIDNDDPKVGSSVSSQRLVERREDVFQLLILGLNVWEVEVMDEELRLIRKLVWSPEIAIQYAIDCAKNFVESTMCDRHTNASAALDIARRFLAGKATPKELEHAKRFLKNAINWCELREAYDLAHHYPEWVRARAGADAARVADLVVSCIKSQTHLRAGTYECVLKALDDSMNLRIDCLEMGWAGMGRAGRWHMNRLFQYLEGKRGPFPKMEIQESWFQRLLNKLFKD